MNAPLDTHDRDAPIFGSRCVFASRRRGRADRESAPLRRPRAQFPRGKSTTAKATFPIENFRDMHGEGLLGICIPKQHGGLGASYAPTASPPPSLALLRRDRALLEHARVLDAVDRRAGG